MQRTSWAAGLELVGDDERCVALAGLLPLRLLAERGGLTAGISAAMHRRGYDPDYDRGPLLVDLGLVLLAGGRTISDFQALAHLQPLIGPVASTPTVWRSLKEADGLRVARIHQAVVRFRRWWWGLLAARPEGFPWLRVAGRELTGITVVDLDASVVKATSDRKENAKATYKGGIGYAPNMVVCDNVDDVLVIDPRPGNATSNDADDNIAALTAGIAAIPGAYRRRVLVRLDGAGFSHRLLEHIASGGGIKGRRWEFSVGWACTDREYDAIDAAPKALWQNGIDQDGTLLDDVRAGRHHRPAGPVRVAPEDPRPADHRQGRTPAPEVHPAGHREREGPRPAVPVHRGERDPRTGGLAGCPSQEPRSCRGRCEICQGDRDEPLALP